MAVGTKGTLNGLPDGREFERPKGFQAERK